MYMWTLHPLPKNILGFLESRMEDIFPVYITPNFFRFYVFWKGQFETDQASRDEAKAYINEEVFVNVFNGVCINTYEAHERTYRFGDRYKEVKFRS
ncbi:MAG: hypothetical protein V2I33_25670 [Kangiellaceae bacterium]|jgi:hypothetical protein|nr:hypothetical protein [Kangiellaceae bacterium]